MPGAARSCLTVQYSAAQSGSRVHGNCQRAADDARWRSGGLFSSGGFAFRRLEVQRRAVRFPSQAPDVAFEFRGRRLRRRGPAGRTSSPETSIAGPCPAGQQRQRQHDHQRRHDDLPAARRRALPRRPPDHGQCTRPCATMRRRCVPSLERVHEATLLRDGRRAGPGRHGHPRRRAGSGRGGRSPHGRRAQGHRTPEHRADAGHRPHRRRPDRPEEPERLVRRERVRRPLEDRQPRHHLHADLRRRRLVHALLRRHRPEGLERRSGSARARATASAARTSATASTSRPTPARRGSASAWRRRSTSARS